MAGLVGPGEEERHGVNKAKLRQQMRGVLQAMSPEERATASARACALLQEQFLWQQARTVLGYAPLGQELDIWPVLAAGLQCGKIICLPRYVAELDAYEAGRIVDLSQDVARGHWGIREPKRDCPVWPINELDLVLVPGVVFSNDGRRLGRGKGYYDQWLATVSGTTCGIAFDQQIQSPVPVEPHDIQLDCILTPTRWLIAGHERF